MIHLDTSVLVEALTGPRPSLAALRDAIDQGERITFSSIVLYEWLRGPRRAAELRAQDALFPAETLTPFGVSEAIVAARLYATVRRGRGREIDLAIAACALVHEAALWTANRADFRDVPDLTLYSPRV